MQGVNPKSRNASFTPKIMDELIETVQKSVKRKFSLTEYFLSVGSEILNTLCPESISLNNRNIFNILIVNTLIPNMVQRHNSDECSSAILSMKQKPIPLTPP